MLTSMCHLQKRREEIAMTCRVKVTGAGVVAYEGEDGLGSVLN